MKEIDTPIETTDQELIARMNSSDEEAFEVLYYRHRDWVLRMAWRIVVDQQLAEDVLQEVFRYFLSKFPGFELRCQLRTFLYPAVRNTALASIRKQQRFFGGESAAVAINQLVAGECHASYEADFHHLISSLSPDHREMVMLRFVDNMTLPEIAQLIGIPLGTAKSRLHHALAALRTDPKIKNV